MSGNPRIGGLDLIRGLAAVCVFLGHFRAACFPPYSQLEKASLAEKVFYGFTAYQHEAVAIFFVLSGFFVGGSVLRQIENFDFKRYLTFRITRLWVVLIPVLLVTLILDTLTGETFPRILAGEFRERWSLGPRPEMAFSLSLVTFFGNLGFLQTLFCPVFGTNGPLWSLAYEFWYYILFPLCLYVLGFLKARTSLRLIAAVFCGTVLLIIPQAMQIGFLCWLMGVVVFVLSRKVRFQSMAALAVALGIFAFGMVGLKGEWLKSGPVPAYFLAALFFAPLCLFLAKETPLSQVLAGGGIAKILSEISYTLYALHFPVLMLMMALFFKKYGVSYPPLSLFIVMLTATFFLSVLFWYLFERNTPAIRRHILKLAKPRE